MLFHGLLWISLITVIVILGLSNLTVAQHSNDEPANSRRIPSRWAKHTIPAPVTAATVETGGIEPGEDESEEDPYAVKTKAETAFIATAQETDKGYATIHVKTTNAATKIIPGMQSMSEWTEEDNESVEWTTTATTPRRKVTTVATVATTEEEDSAQEDTTGAAVTTKQTTTAKPATTQAPSSKEDSSEDEDDEDPATAGLKVTTAAKIPDEHYEALRVKVTKAEPQVTVEESDEEFAYVASTATPKRNIRQTTSAAAEESTDDQYEDTTTTVTKAGKLTTGKQQYGALRTTPYKATMTVPGSSEPTSETASGENAVITNEIVMTPKKRWHTTVSQGVTSRDNRVSSDQGSAPPYTGTAHAPVNITAIPMVPPYSPSGTSAHVITGPFSIQHVIGITADTRRARDRIMEEQIKPNWKLALGPEIESFKLTIESDQTYSSPSVPDGTNVRQITYEIAGISPGRLDTEAAVTRFHRLAGAAGLRDLWAILDSNEDMVLASTIPTMPTTVVMTSLPPANQRAPEAVTVPAIPLGSTTLTSQAPAVVPATMTHDEPVTRRIPMYEPKATGSLLLKSHTDSDTSDASLTASQLTATVAFPSSAPQYIETAHVITGPFSIRDVIAITAITRRSRDRIMEEQIRPNWSLALGQGIGSFKLTIVSDQPYSTPSTPDGKAIRQITYEIAGISSGPLDATTALNKFHHLALAAGLRDMWAIPDSDGDLVLAPIIPTMPSTLVTTPAPPASPRTPKAVTPRAPATLKSPASTLVTEIVTHDGPIIGRVHKYKPKATGSLLLKSYADSDALPVQQTAEVMRNATLGVSVNSVQIDLLNSSGPSEQTPTYNYPQKTDPNVTANPTVALPTFTQIISLGDLPLVEQEPATVQISAAASISAGTATMSTRLPVVIASEPTTTIVPLGLALLPPVLPAYNHTLNASMLDALQVNLRILWSKAYGVPQSQVVVNIQGAQSVGLDQMNRSISRVRYAVQSTSKHETPEVVQAFQQLFQTSPMMATQKGAAVKVPSDTATVIHRNFLQLRRPVQPRAEAETTAPVAAALVEADNSSLDVVVVNTTPMAPTVDDGGPVSSNITYAVTAAPGPQLAAEEFMTEKLAHNNLTDCDNCFMVPVHKVTMSKADRPRPHGSAQYPSRSDPGGHPDQPDL